MGHQTVGGELHARKQQLVGLLECPQGARRRALTDPRRGHAEEVGGLGSRQGGADHCAHPLLPIRCRGCHGDGSVNEPGLVVEGGVVLTELGRLRVPMQDAEQRDEFGAVEVLSDGLGRSGLEVDLSADIALFDGGHGHLPHG